MALNFLLLFVSRQKVKGKLYLFEVKKSAVGGRRSADELSWKGSGDFHFFLQI